MPAELLAMATVGAGVAVAGALVRHRIERRRTASAMYSLGLRAIKGSLLDILNTHGDLACFQLGHNHRIWDVMCGPFESGRITALRHSYERGFGARRTHHVQRIAIVETDQPLPGVVAIAGDELVPVGPFEHYRRIALPEAEGLEPSWMLYTDRPGRGRELQVALVQWIARTGSGAWLWQMRGHRIAAAAHGKGQPDQFVELVENVRRFARSLGT